MDNGNAARELTCEEWAERLVSGLPHNPKPAEMLAIALKAAEARALAQAADEIDAMRRKARALRLHAYEGETTEMILFDLVSYYKALGETLPKAISDLENVWERTQRST